MTTRAVHFIVLVLLLWAAGSPALANVVEIAFEGTIDFVDPQAPFADSISVGDFYSGWYEYDQSVADNFPGNPSVGGYSFPDSALSIRINSVAISTADLGISILNSNPPLYDDYGVWNASAFVAYGLTWRAVGITLRDATGTAFQNDSLPAVAPNLDDFEFAHVLRMIPEGHFNPYLSGTLTWIAVIPEPGALTLLVTGVAFAAKRRGEAWRPR